MNKNSEKLIYVGIIIILIGILSIRVLVQGRKIKKSLNKIKEEGVELTETTKDKKSKKQEEKINLEKEFTSPDGNLSFKYPKEWNKMKNEKLLNIFNPSTAQKNTQLPEGMNQKEIKKLEEVAGNTDSENGIKGKTFFIAVRGQIPQFSLGIVSAQKIDIKEKTIGHLEQIMKKEFNKKSKNSTKKIINLEKGKNFVSVETITYMSERPTFKSKNIGFISNNNIYMMSFSSPYGTWENFQSEFNLIISTIEFNEK